VWFFWWLMMCSWTCCGRCGILDKPITLIRVTFPERKSRGGQIIARAPYVVSSLPFLWFRRTGICCVMRTVPRHILCSFASFLALLPIYYIQTVVFDRECSRFVLWQYLWSLCGWYSVWITVGLTSISTVMVFLSRSAWMLERYLDVVIDRILQTT
jgi:hypothetical protein